MWTSDFVDHVYGVRRRKSRKACTVCGNGGHDYPGGVYDSGSFSLEHNCRRYNSCRMTVRVTSIGSRGTSIMPFRTPKDSHFSMEAIKTRVFLESSVCRSFV